MSRTLTAAKIVMAVLVSAALTGPAHASGNRDRDSHSDAMYSSPRAIQDAQLILEQNQYLEPGSYDKGDLGQTTVSAIVHFQAVHSLRKTGSLNFDTLAMLSSHAMSEHSAFASSEETSETYAYMPAVVYRPTSQPLFVDNKPLILEGVEFDINKATLRPESRATLDQVAASLKTWPNVMVEIQGHTSEPGTRVHNLDLSQRRADAVRAYFVSEGIDGTRLVAKGYGETRFIANNSTEEGRRENRRVELHEIR